MHNVQLTVIMPFTWTVKKFIQPTW